MLKASMRLTTTILFLLLQVSVGAATLDFVCTTNNTGVCSTNIAPYFSVDLNDLGGNQVELIFFNNMPSGTTGRIKTAFIDEGATDWFSSFIVVPTPGTSFSTSLGGNLPGGAPFSFSSDHQAHKVGAAANGVDRLETLNLVGTLNAGRSYQQLIDSLTGSPSDTAGLRVGLHIISIGLNGRDFSDSLISFRPDDGSQVPEPTTFALAGAALAALGLYRRLNK